MREANYNFLLIFCLVAVSLNGCWIEPEEEDYYSYAFVTAGHTYGTSGVDNVGLHPKFEAQFPYLNQYEHLDFCFLTGDVVIESTEKNWNEVDSVLEFLDAEVHIAPGNHDLSGPVSYETIVGERYYTFKHNGDLYVILEPYGQGWNVLGQQKEMLLNALEEHKASGGFTFIFFHHPIWYEVDNKYGVCGPNAENGKNGTSNFLPEIVPHLLEMPNDVAVYAGDVGGWQDKCAVIYDHFDNVHFIGSGMGGGHRDNIVITKIYEKDSLDFQLVALHNKRNSLGTLEDYWLH